GPISSARCGRRDRDRPFSCGSRLRTSAAVRRSRRRRTAARAEATGDPRYTLPTGLWAPGCAHQHQRPSISWLLLLAPDSAIGISGVSSLVCGHRRGLRGSLLSFGVASLGPQVDERRAIAAESGRDRIGNLARPLDACRPQAHRAREVAEVDRWIVEFDAE